MTVVRGNKGIGKAIGGAAAPTATVAPVPINTPSVKRENNGRDPSVNLVPATRSSGVWGNNSSGNEDSPSDNRSSSQQPTPTISTFSKPAPWAKPSVKDAGSSAETVAALPLPASRAPVTNWAEDVESDEDEDSSAAPPQSRMHHTVAPQQSRKERTGSGSYGDSHHDEGGRFGRAGPGDARHSGSHYQSDYGRPSGNHSGFSSSPNYGGIAGPGAYRNAPNRGSGSDRSFGHMQPSNNSYGSSKYETSLSAEQRAIEEARQEAELLEAKKLRKRTMSSEGTGGYSGETQGSAGVHSSEDRQQSYSGYGNDRRDYGRSSNNSSNRGREDYPSSASGSYGYGGGNARISHRPRGPSFDHEPSASTSSEPTWERARRPELAVSSTQSRATGLSVTSPYAAPMQQMSLPPSLHMNAPTGASQQPPADAVRVKRTRGPTTPRESSEEVNRNAAAQDVSKSYSSLFERKEQQSAQEAALPHQHVQFLHTTQNETTLRVGPPQSTPPESRRKMLFDPQSNVFRELGVSDKPSTMHSRKAEQDRADRRSGPPAVEGAETARRTLQVQRIEQNRGEKWVRQSITKPAGVTRSVAPEPENADVLADDDRETESLREAEQESRKAARAKERAERGPRTKGFLFHYNAEGEIERVFTPEEKVRADALKQRKLEKADRDRKLAGVDINVEELPLHLLPDQFKALTLEQKQQLKERQIAARESAQKAPATVPSTAVAVKKFDPTVEFTSEEYRALSKEQKDAVKAHQIQQKEARKSAARAQRVAEKRSSTESTTAVSEQESRSLASGELDIQKVALEAEATRSKQPVKAFIPGQAYHSLAEPSVWGSTGEGAQSHWDNLPSSGYSGSLTVSAPQPMYTTDPSSNWSSYKSYPGAPEPALFGGNTSFLGNQETSLGSRFAALASQGVDSDEEEEEYEDVEEEEQQQEERPVRVSGGRGGRGGRSEYRRTERGDRGRGRGYSGRISRIGPPAVPVDSALAAAAQRSNRETAGRSSGRGGRESSRPESADPNTASQYGSTGRGRGTSSRGRGRGRGDGDAADRPVRESVSAGRSSGRLGGRGTGRITVKTEYRPRTTATSTA